MRRLFLVALTVALFLAVGSGTAFAQGGGGGGGNACPPRSPAFPALPPPGCGLERGGDGTCFDRIDNDNDGHTDRGDSECRDPNDMCENGAPGCPEDGGGGGGGGGCPPADGPISGIVQQISDAIRDGGGAPLADVIDTINCEIIVGVLGLSGPDVGA